MSSLQKPWKFSLYSYPGSRCRWDWTGSCRWDSRWHRWHSRSQSPGRRCPVWSPLCWHTLTRSDTRPVQCHYFRKTIVNDPVDEGSTSFRGYTIYRWTTLVPLTVHSSLGNLVTWNTLNTLPLPPLGLVMLSPVTATARPRRLSRCFISLAVFSWLMFNVLSPCHGIWSVCKNHPGPCFTVGGYQHNTHANKDSHFLLHFLHWNFYGRFVISFP